MPADGRGKCPALATSPTRVTRCTAPLRAPFPPRLQIKRAHNLRSASGGTGPFYAYVVAHLGAVSHRTRVEDQSTNPDWNEQVVFDASSTERGPPVITFEVWAQGYLVDELVSAIWRSELMIWCGGGGFGHRLVGPRLAAYGRL